MFYMFLLFIVAARMISTVTYERDQLLHIRDTMSCEYAMKLVIQNAFPVDNTPVYTNSNPKTSSTVRRTRKRGKRSGALCRFRSRSLRPALPAIVLANVRSLRNKADELFNMLSFNREFKDSSVLCFTETWLDSTTPDEAVCPQSHSMFRVDRSYELTGKRRGGGVCFMVNKRWCIDSKLTSTLCSRDLETITVDCRPFYSPREFASIVLMGVYIPPMPVQPVQ